MQSHALTLTPKRPHDPANFFRDPIISTKNHFDFWNFIVEGGSCEKKSVAFLLLYSFHSKVNVCFDLFLFVRLRNVKNKLVNVSEAMGLSKQTPMAIFLRELGIESEIKMNWRGHKSNYPLGV